MKLFVGCISFFVISGIYNGAAHLFLFLGDKADLFDIQVDWGLSYLMIVVIQLIRILDYSTYGRLKTGASRDK